ncbi:hypothetical protein S7335_90 [Synechococcus sp. PCC 7335]|uniref:hypothetical protein n=1 Tax=Synechococcus sp. (strain ATCC 29403 / PCC 7335) TaxID=91464 RepID=UPI00017ECB5B|nr:hypothetical protein [Synechococcus sp. PCC 7335]EDX82912.1 hypothetical protein S7335_90 [Synechococcus sp. PCC 7335]
MKVAVFSTKPYDRQFLAGANLEGDHALTFFEARLTPETAALAAGFPVACVFIHDQLNEETLSAIAAGGTRLIILRAAGSNNVQGAVTA